MAAQLRDALLERMRKTASGEMVAFDKRHVYEVLAVAIDHVAVVRADDALRAGEVINSLKAEVATLKGAMAAQDERERLAGDQCGIPWQEHQCDWPDAVAEALIVSREREYPGYKREKALRCAAEARNQELREGWVKDERKFDNAFSDACAERDRLRAAVTAIHTAVRDDEKGECWTIRRYLDERDIFNDDIQGSDRLVELACEHVLKAATQPTHKRDQLREALKACEAVFVHSDKFPEDREPIELWADERRRLWDAAVVAVREALQQ